MTVTETLLTSLLDSAISCSFRGSMVSRLLLTDEVLSTCQGFLVRTTSMTLISYEVLKDFVILRSLLNSWFSWSFVVVRLMNQLYTSLPTLFESSCTKVSRDFDLIALLSSSGKDTLPTKD